MIGALYSISNWELLLRLAIAAGLGAAVGLERELRERQAGLRTHLLVCVGSALFTLVSAYGFRGVRVDPTRIAAQVVTGIGFLGAGAIIRQGLSIRGLTTAATLWLVAAIGMATGAGYYAAALIATGGALLSLGPLRWVSYRGTRRFRSATRRLLVEVPAGGSPAPVIERVERFGTVSSIDVSQEGDSREIAIDLELLGQASPQVVAAVAEIDGVRQVRWSD